MCCSGLRLAQHSSLCSALHVHVCAVAHRTKCAVRRCLLCATLPCTEPHCSVHAVLHHTLTVHRTLWRRALHCVHLLARHGVCYGALHCVHRTALCAPYCTARRVLCRFALSLLGYVVLLCARRTAPCSCVLAVPQLTVCVVLCYTARWVLHRTMYAVTHRTVRAVPHCTVRPVLHCPMRASPHCFVVRAALYCVCCATPYCVCCAVRPALCALCRTVHAVLCSAPQQWAEGRVSLPCAP